MNIKFVLKSFSFNKKVSEYLTVDKYLNMTRNYFDTRVCRIVSDQKK